MTKPPALGPTLETERLLLRPPAAEDFEPWAAFAADPQVARFLGGVQSKPLAWRNICTMIGSWVVNGFGMFSAIEKSTGRWVGRLGPWQPEGWPVGEIACSLVVGAWGKGYAVEGMSASMDWAVDALGWTELAHCVDDKNVAAQKLVLRLGGRRLRRGVLPEPFGDDVGIWGQTRDEWLARRRR